LNLFEEREKKNILDPFVGNGTIPLFGIIQDFQTYGSDIDKKKVINTTRNINWLLEVLEEDVPFLLNERFITADIKNLSNKFKKAFFDGICTEPSLGPFYKNKPYYIQVKELIENELEPLYINTFREANVLLKKGCRLVLVAPVFSTIDGGDLQINIEKIGRNNNFILVPMLDTNRIINKSNQKLQFREKHVKSLLDAKKGQILKRKIYVFEKK
ncbi:MAG: TRM11 family SAM-dependent methyltransferase, partial [Promethearchaeota archaeon]